MAHKNRGTKKPVATPKTKKSTGFGKLSGHRK